MVLRAVGCWCGSEVAVEQAAVRLDAEERAAGREAVDPQLFAGICADLEREGFFRQEDGRLFP